MVHSKKFLYLVLTLSVFTGQFAEAQKNIPHLKKQGTATLLIVEGKPFLVLGGELGNSTASDLNYLKPFWQNFKTMNLNTILAPVYWELMEPKEGKFDFTHVDGLINDARKYKMKLVLLWFGSWKNSISCYAPVWVKTNLNRFPRSQKKEGQGMEILTPFSRENLEADKKAFASLMKHLRESDRREQTVIMVQVENEVGMIPEARDYCGKANELFNAEVPVELMSYLQEHKEQLIPEFREFWSDNDFKRSGTWEKVFGNSVFTDEVFMAWYYSQYINEIAAAGKKEYPLPMFVNAALVREGYKPGQYPSAGPLPHLMDIWRAGAPQSIFFRPIFISPTFRSGAGNIIGRKIHCSFPKQAATTKVLQEYSMLLGNMTLSVFPLFPLNPSILQLIA